MKKVLAIILAVFMLFTLVACNGSGGNDNTPAAGESSSPAVGESSSPAAGGSSPAAGGSSPAAGGSSPSVGGNSPAPGERPELPPEEDRHPYPNANPDGTMNLDKIAHFDPDYDYTQNPRYKFAYISQASGPLNITAANAFEHWANFFNMEWHGFVGANGDADLFMTQLQNLIDQGVDAIVCDPDNTIMQATVNLLNKYPHVAWMNRMSPARDGMEGTPYIGGNLINNYVGFDNYDAGVQQTIKVTQWLEDNYPNAPLEEVGLLAMGFSVSPPFQERVMGAEQAWLDWGGLPENFFFGDAVATGLNLQGGIDTAGPIISINGHIKYWLVVANVDDFGLGVSSIISQQGLEDTTCIVVFGGSALLTQWDGGQYDAFRYALFAGPLMYGEPLMGACYAFLNGWTTPNEIWPSWVKWDDHGIDGNTFSQFRLPTTWISAEDYQHFLGWTDVYANANQYPNYPKDYINRDDFSAFVPVPDNYAQP